MEKKEVKRIKLSDLGKKMESDKLSQLKGGADISELSVGCLSYVCANERGTASDLCSTAYCASGVGG